MSDAIGGAIQAIGNIAGQFISNAGSARQNRKNREWQEEMWNKNNAYNTPTMQMARFKEAGLNPHLIYGQGNSGNSGGPPSLPPQRPEGQLNFGDAIASYVANRKQQTEIDNMKKAQEVMEADKTLKDAQTVNTLSSSAKTQQETVQASELFDTVSAQAQANLRNTTLQTSKIQADIDNTLQSTKLSQTQQSQLKQSIEESRSRIQNMKVENDLKGQEVELKKLELELNKKGIMKSDPAYMRIMSRVIDEVTKGDDIKVHNKSNGETYKFKKFSFWDWFSK
jgi:hypothetical protein